MDIGMSFFSYAPFNRGDCMVPKNGMKFPALAGPAGGRLDSSRFSGQLSEHTKGRAKKDIPMSIDFTQVGMGPSATAGNRFQKDKMIRYVFFAFSKIVLVPNTLNI
jgi:hypothetical protein